MALTERRLEAIRERLLASPDPAAEDAARELVADHERLCELLTDAWVVLDSIVQAPPTADSARVAAQLARELLFRQRAPGYRNTHEGK